MKKKNLLLPCAIFAAVLTFYSISTFTDPLELIKEASQKMLNYTDLKLNYEMTMRVSMMGTEIDYVSQYVLSKSGELTAYVANHTAPFSIGTVTSSRYSIPSGNFSCTSEYGINACYPTYQFGEFTSDLTSIESFIKDGTVKIEPLGRKVVNNIECENLRIILNSSFYNQTTTGVNPEINMSYMADLGKMDMIMCIDKKTGFTIESNVVMEGRIRDPTSQLSLNMAYNITQKLSNYSFDVPLDDFILPYTIMSFEEYESLINSTLLEA